MAGVRTHVQIKSTAYFPGQCRLCKRPNNLTVKVDTDYGNGQSQADAGSLKFKPAFDSRQGNVDIGKRPRQRNMQRYASPGPPTESLVAQRHFKATFQLERSQRNTDIEPTMDTKFPVGSNVTIHGEIDEVKKVNR